jgi:hypothetical protein
VAVVPVLVLNIHQVLEVLVAEERKMSQATPTRVVAAADEMQRQQQD